MVVQDHRSEQAGIHDSIIKYNSKSS